MNTHTVNVSDSLASHHARVGIKSNLTTCQIYFYHLNPPIELKFTHLLWVILSAVSRLTHKNERLRRSAWKKNSNAYIRVTPSESKREMNRSRDVSPLKLRKNFLTSSFLNKTQMNAYERKKCIRLLGNQKNSN